MEDLTNTYTIWLKENEESLKALYADFLSDTGTTEKEQPFPEFCRHMFQETIHANPPK